MIITGNKSNGFTLIKVDKTIDCARCASCKAITFPIGHLSSPQIYKYNGT